MTEVPQPTELNSSGEIVRYWSKLLFDADDESSPEFPITEERLQELMQELSKEITPSPCFTNVHKNSPPLPPSLSPYAIPPSLPFGSRNESCGATISGFGSTVMAGAENVGHRDGTIGGQVVECGNDGGLIMNNEKIVGCDVWDVEDGDYHQLAAKSA